MLRVVRQRKTVYDPVGIWSDPASSPLLVRIICPHSGVSFRAIPALFPVVMGAFFCDGCVEFRLQDGQKVGLRNLGATCYLNSLLQIWHHNPNLRREVFKWDPKVSPDGFSSNQKVMAQLQRVFAHLQGGNQPVYNPAPFVDALSLSHSIQQDGLEYGSSLFLTIVLRACALCREYRATPRVLGDGSASSADRCTFGLCRHPVDSAASSWGSWRASCSPARANRKV